MSKSTRSRREKPSIEVHSSFFIKQVDGTEIEVDEATWKDHFRQHVDTLPDNDALKKIAMRLSLAAFVEAARSNPTGPEAKLIEDNPARFMALVHDFERKGWIPSIPSMTPGVDAADGLGTTDDDGAEQDGSAGRPDDPRPGR